MSVILVIHAHRGKRRGIAIGLFSFWMEDYSFQGKREPLSKIAKISRQKKLWKIAIQAHDHDFRRKAVEMLSDQTLLLDIAQNSISNLIRFEAAQKLNNGNLAQEVYADLAKDDMGKGRYAFRLNVAEKLTDQNLAREVYYDIAMCAEAELEHQIGAVRCLIHQNSLLDLAKNGNSDFVRFEAAQRVDDQNLAQEIYCDIAKKSSIGGFIEKYIPTLLDKVIQQNLILDIAKNSASRNVRFIAAQRLTDQNLAQETYCDIAKECERTTDIQAVLEKMIDPKLIIDVIVSVSFDSCQSALGRIDDNDTLDYIARKAKDADVRAKACEKVGHLYGENCVCNRCNVEEHSFSDGICMRCNAMFKKTRSEHKCSACDGTGSFRSYEMISPGYSGSDNYQDPEWGYITRECGLCRGTGKITDVSQYIVYASGEEKLLKSI